MESDTISGTITVSDYFGGCSHCGANHGCLNVGPAHFVVCDTHKTKWRIGSNLFSGWKDENESIWRQNAERLESYSEVEPLPQGVWSADPEKQQRELKEARGEDMEWNDREGRLRVVRENVVAILQDALKSIPASLQKGDEVYVHIPGRHGHLIITSAGIALSGDLDDDIPF